MDSPADFSKYNLNTVRHADYFLKKYKHLFNWGNSEEMLEVGGGNGRIANEVLHPFVESHLNHLLGSDYSQEAVNVANKVYSKPNLSFVRMDIADPKVGEEYKEKFGHIFAFYCFQLVHPSEAWAANIYKMLKPNGEVFGTLNLTPNLYTKVIDEQKREKSTPWIKYVENTPDSFVDYGPNPIESVTRILANVGLSVTMISIDHVDVIFEDDETFRRVNASANHIVKNLPEELRTAYMEDFQNKCASHSTKDENGHRKSNMRALVFLASKKL